MIHIRSVVGRAFLGNKFKAFEIEVAEVAQKLSLVERSIKKFLTV
jgi:hypothetical protein